MADYEAVQRPTKAGAGEMVRTVRREGDLMVYAPCRLGPLAVTERVLTSDHGWHSVEGWNVTHVPTGMAMGRRWWSTAQDARKWMRSMHTLVVWAGELGAMQSADASVAVNVMRRHITKCDAAAPPLLDWDASQEHGRDE